MQITCFRAVYLVCALTCCGTLFTMAVVVGLIFAFGDSYKPVPRVEVVEERSELGEGPYWDAGHQRLYWVDMRRMLINSYTPSTGQLFQADVSSDEKPVTMVIRVKDTEDKFVIALKGSLALIQWDGASNTTVRPVHLMDIIEDSSSGSRCNDGKVDPSNRLWVEVMGSQIESNPKGNKFEEDMGEVFRIDPNENGVRKTRMLDKMQIPNGLEWSLDNRCFYVIDSLAFTVTEYEYNDKEGTLKNSRLIYNLKEKGMVGTADKPNTLPDGMTIDEKGLLWVAVYGTGKVIRLDPTTGEKAFELQLAGVLQPTSVCFGGKDLDTLYVTSAHVDWTPEFEKKYPQSGKLFKISNLDVKGASPSRPISLPRYLLEKAFEKSLVSTSTSTNTFEKS